MNSLVLGGAGFIGRHLCAALAAAGHQVYSFDRTPVHGVWPNITGITWLTGDFSDQSSLAKALKNIDIVFHLISTSIPVTSNEQPYDDLQNNVGATLRLLDTIIGQSCQPKVIFFSSGGTIYGIPHTIPISESHPTDPLCAYGIGKLAIEKYLALYHRLHGLDYRILRLANPYGEFQSPYAGQGAIPAFLHKALCDAPVEIWGDGSVVRDYFYIGDAITAIAAAINYGGAERIFNIGSGVGHNVNDVIRLLCELLGKDVACHYLPARPCDVPVNILDISLARTELGWQPVTSLPAGMTLMLEYLRTANPPPPYLTNSPS